MQYCKEVRSATLLVVLFAVWLHHVGCHGDARLQTSTSSIDDPCGNQTVPCNPAESRGALAVTIVSSFISSAILLLPIFRVKALQPRRSETDTLFWWSIFFGFLGYGLWSLYFMHCNHPNGSVFYILLACKFGAVVYFGFLIVATSKTSTAGDVRLHFGLPVASVLFLLAGLLKLPERHYFGWVALGFSALSHLCRIESTDYHGDFDIWMFVASLVGAISSFLWLIHPQLCLSTEYKLNSYIIGVLRGGETFFWRSRAISRLLWKFEGVIGNAAPAGGNVAASALAARQCSASTCRAAAAIDAPAPECSAC